MPGTPRPSSGTAGKQRHSKSAAAAPVPGTILPFRTVAIGASAGGLQAFTSFLAALPPDTGMAFVLIQHLDPTHKSLLVSLLASHTAMPVLEAIDGMPLSPDMVFVIPSDATMTVRNGLLAVSSPAPPRADRHPIDTCFTSLAEDQRQNAVAIVLAGIGSDGSLGLAAVKRNGGVTFAQAEEGGQAMAGMPHSAVATGFVDHLLPVGAIPAKLIADPDQPNPAPDDADDSGTPGMGHEEFRQLCTILRDRTGHDFSQYKRPTLLRRTYRRMQAERVATVPAFIDLLRREPQQIDQMFHELLIGVTQFLRDPLAFQALRETVLPRLLAGKGAADTVRIWVPGCASGEEVYTLAILLRELMDQQPASPKAQLFGTDIDERAIAVARTGRYPGPALGGFTPEQRGKWFHADGKHHCVARTIREMCVFSIHSVTRDPPFSKLDMVSCRNLLIYLDGELQSRVLRSFHYALNPDGILFLGQSEGVTHGASLFTLIDKRHRIFARCAQEAARGSGSGNSARAIQELLAGSARPVSTVAEDGIDRNARRALEQFAPAYVVIDRNRDIIRFSSGAIGRFLEPSPGAASLNLFGIVRKPLRPAVRAAVQKAIAGHETVIAERLIVPLDGRKRLITLIVKPITDGRASRDLFVAAFQDAGPARTPVRKADPSQPTADPDSTSGEPDLASELSATRAQLMTLVTDLETANEELKSHNEEFQSSNEELQATNEELETAKEEMQSVNEELHTINAELLSKNDLANKLNDDLQNLMASTQIATLFLDRHLNVTRFTPRVTELFHMRQSDLGRPVTEITSRLAYTTIGADVAATLGGQEVVEHEVLPIAGDATFLMQMRPYRSAAHGADGVVITFVDISQQKRQEAEAALQAQNATLERRVAERTAELEAASAELARQTDERQRAEDMLRQSQKMEAVGKLTGGIAHDFNNLLGVIIGNLELLPRVPPGEPDFTEILADALGAAQRGAVLTRRLLTFARRHALAPECIDLNALLPAQIAMLRRMVEETIHITSVMAPGLWATVADPSQVGDALLNLALNARDAMPDGGSLTIETSNLHLDESQAASIPGATPGDYVVLGVSDTGSGMPPEVLERAAEPFFSTKAAGSGSGLGLSMIYGFARQSGGHLRIASQVDVGTTVSLYLPRAPEEAAARAGTQVVASPDAGGSEAILVVDDNTELADVARRNLIAMGYTVTVADSGLAALAILRSGQKFDLLFTDIVMPLGMTGFELADEAQLLQPDLRVLFTSGYAEKVAPSSSRNRGVQHMLPKPYGGQELGQKVRAVLDEPPVVGPG